MGLVLRSLVLWILVAVITVGHFVVLVPIAAVAFPFDPKKNAAHWVARSWARMLMRMNPGCTVSVKGAENVSKIGGSGASVICANHESMADIIALYYVGHPFKWIAKQSLFFVPFMGWGMWFAGYIPLKRGQKDSILRCMETAALWLRRGVSIAMFPEGTRSFDGRVKAFKDGAFRLSVDQGVPILPVALEGPRSMLNKGSWLFATKTHMKVYIGEPILPQGKGPEEIDRLKRTTREWILRSMAEMKGVTPESLDASGAGAEPARNRAAS